ncbi:hypothetical protein [Parvularcula sp. LCG005]|uniref:hypothetical protein n=1 Tax=Parvularcula sp. LCG005 TaxID=3078805 RepID=UPI0029429DCD|nr:hypothetical protein [Parvularcula sp. LCG005]WOI53707.1 hypothetical protein RUI03_01615 [Parvularcula sp. LCG005]
MTVKMSQKKQADRFSEAARELECDESEEAFDRAMKRIAKAPPKTDAEIKEAAEKDRPKTGPGSNPPKK